MKIKRFFAKDMRSALAEVKEVLGPEAVIMSNKKVTGGVEIVAAIDFAAPAVAAPTRAEPSLATRPLGDDRVSLSTRSEPTFGGSSSNRVGMRQGYDAEPQPAARPAPSAAHPEGLRALLERQQQLRQQRHAEQQAAQSLPSREVLPQWAQTAFTPPQAEREPAHPPQPKAVASATAASSHGGGRNQAAVEISAMREEMASIRKLLQHQVSSLMEQDIARSQPLQSMVREQLEDLGFVREVADHFAKRLPQQGEMHQILAQLPNLVAEELRCGSEHAWHQGGVFALVGPTGVGKTTSIAKLAARLASRFGIDQVALVTTDNYRIGAKEQLLTFGKIMGCPVRSAASVEELEQVLYSLRSRRIVLIDTAGMGQRDMRLMEQLERLASATRVAIKPYLVLPATAQYRVLRETLERFQRIDIAGCIITKLDEAHSIGEVLSVLLQNNLPVCYLTDGQRVPEDLRTADPHYLAQRALTEEQLNTAGAGRLSTNSANAEQRRAVGHYD
ncbi:flagellar biosynthesis protein FlhF [Ferrimonas senticii]|uniref:flagellar biosynthesis protein FlhF n=1 Tax=Ferrimonas senticii TaxID=394566 RepID=UPI0004207E4F|nr:flagellar biosynthesis protein FlhF [Ferrimonas senticii]